MEFRVLGPGDVGHMHSLLSLFGRAFDDADTYDSARPGDGYLAELLASPGFVVVVALHGDRVAGGLAAYVLPKFEQARSEVYIYDLAVDEPFRRRGVATGLIDRLRAVALYSKLGTAEDVLHFDIPPHRGAAPDRAPPRGES